MKLKFPTKKLCFQVNKFFQVMSSNSQYPLGLPLQSPHSLGPKTSQKLVRVIRTLPCLGHYTGRFLENLSKIEHLVENDIQRILRRDTDFWKTHPKQSIQSKNDIQRILRRDTDRFLENSSNCSSHPDILEKLKRYSQKILDEFSRNRR